MEHKGQQLPATGSRFAKPVKKLFVSSNDWIFCGIDFSSLEDRISALTTKDPNKLKVYIDGYDGHCLRAYYYFSNQMTDINPDNVESINSISSKYHSLRQMSKAPTFALTYNGTYLTLMNNCGFDLETAKQIENNYHKMYKVSDEWQKNKINEAVKNGYIITGLGLKVRTPLLHNNPNYNDNPYSAAEARTAGNALGQGWGVLNDRAMNAVMNQIDKDNLSNDILPVGKVHDCCYYLVRNDIKLIHYLNQLVVKEAHWNNHPDIYHPQVGLGGQLDLFYPNWATPLTLPEDCTEEELISLAQDHINKHKD